MKNALGLRVSIDTGYSMALDELTPFQNDMKTLNPENYLKLKGEIWETGFSFAVHVWGSPDGKFFILDGHQRVECLKRMCTEAGVADSEQEIPVVIVDAKDFREAKRKCLAAASQFGRFDVKALQKTLSEAELPTVQAVKMFDFPMVDLLNGTMFQIPTNKPAEERKIIQGDEEFSKEVDEKNNYLVFLFDSKEDFDSACAKFGVKPVISMLSREYNEKMATRGIGRILPGKDLLK